MTLRIKNQHARGLWLQTNGLAHTPTGPVNAAETIRQLGFVQLDSIRNVTRAHHHILWSRNQNYREPMLHTELADRRSVFENFTHDAAAISMEFYPLWARQFRRLGEKIEKLKYFSDIKGFDVETLRNRIRQEGPLCTRDFESAPTENTHLWARPPHKLALDYLWYKGELATAYRRNFVKYYDLAERVIPAHIRAEHYDDAAQIDGLCRAAIARLGVGSTGDVQRFWDAISLSEAKRWFEDAQHECVPVEVETAKGDWLQLWGAPDIETRLKHLKPPTSRLRIINPFDPAIRDRKRLMALFGMDYRIEIFVPAAKRQWGYYVYPLLEGHKFVGRMEIKADRKKGTLTVTGFWPEEGYMWSAQRYEKLDAELQRFARLIGVEHIGWMCSKS